MSDVFDILAALQELMCDDTEELDKLEGMLKDAGIPYLRMPTHLCYYGKEVIQREYNQGPGVNAICSVIAHGYGSEEGLLEISGLVTKEEIETSGRYVLGYLDAENVFKRIKTHYDSLFDEEN